MENLFLSLHGSSQRIAHTSLVVYQFLVEYHILILIKGSNWMPTPSMSEKDIELLYHLIESLLLSCKFTRPDISACVSYIIVRIESSTKYHEDEH